MFDGKVILVIVGLEWKTMDFSICQLTPRCIDFRTRGGSADGVNLDVQVDKLENYC